MNTILGTLLGMDEPTKDLSQVSIDTVDGFYKIHPLGPNVRQNVKMGETSEQIFSCKCFAEYGYMVSTPIGTADYDFVVEVKNKLLKIQVKSSQKGIGNVNICKGTSGSGTMGKYPYPENAIDFFAVHDVVPNEWYMIPRKATGGAMNIRLAQKRVGKYTQYKDNWDFIG